MPKWTDYTIKTNPADKDEVMILDTAGKANKRLGLSALSDWILNKLADKVFQRLETDSKTVLGAINELNSNRLKANSYIIKNDSSAKTVSIKWGNVNSHMTSLLLTNNNRITSLYIAGRLSGVEEISKKSEYAALPVLDISSVTLKVTLVPWSVALLICFEPVTIS